MRHLSIFQRPNVYHNCLLKQRDLEILLFAMDCHVCSNLAVLQMHVCLCVMFAVPVVTDRALMASVFQ